MSSRTDGRAAGRKIRDDSTELNPQRKRPLKKKPSSSARTAPVAAPRTELATTKHVHFSLYQTMLNVFSAAFPEMLMNSHTIQTKLQPTLQEVKGHLFNRDFDAAFGKEDYCEAYAARWSASRALGYVDILKEAVDEIYSRPPKLPGAGTTTTRATTAEEEDASLSSNLSNMSLNSPTSPLNIVCLGGGAGAELCALAGVHRLMQNIDNLPSSTTETDSSIHQRTSSINATLVDMANWLTVLTSLSTSLTTPPQISPYASSVSKSQLNPPLIHPSSLTTTFLHHDLLSSTSSQTSTTFHAALTKANLITLAFTLNELYTTSIPRTQSFLLDLTARTKVGSLLFVIDSAGSYSTIQVNGTEKRYPMIWLLEHLLLKLAPEALGKAEGEARARECGSGAGREDGEGAHRGKEWQMWERIRVDESRWFRLPAGLVYPIELENMRFQMGLYKRI